MCKYTLTDKQTKTPTIYKCHTWVTLTIHSMLWNKTAHSFTVKGGLAQCQSSVWPLPPRDSLSIAPGLVSKSLQANLTLFKLEPLARQAILHCTLLAITDPALKKGLYNYVHVAVQCSLLPHSKRDLQIAIVIPLSDKLLFPKDKAVFWECQEVCCHLWVPWYQQNHEGKGGIDGFIHQH